MPLNIINWISHNFNNKMNGERKIEKKERKKGVKRERKRERELTLALSALVGVDPARAALNWTKLL